MLEELHRQNGGLNIAETAGKIILEDREENIARFTPDHPVRWTAGTYNPFYVDCRKILSIPDAREIVIELFKMKIADLQDQDPNFRFHALAGVITAGFAYAALLARDFKLPLVGLRAEAKAHGSGSAVAGIIQKDTTYLAIEDVYSTYGSTATAIGNLRTEAAAKFPDNSVPVVTHSIAIMSYDWPKTREKADQANVKAESLTTFPDLLRVGLTIPLKEGGIDERMERELREWYLNPQEWSDAHAPAA